MIAQCLAAVGIVTGNNSQHMHGQLLPSSSCFHGNDLPLYAALKATILAVIPSGTQCLGK